MSQVGQVNMQVWETNQVSAGVVIKQRFCGDGNAAWRHYSIPPHQLSRTYWVTVQIVSNYRTPDKQMVSPVVFLCRLFFAVCLVCVWCVWCGLHGFFWMWNEYSVCVCVFFIIKSAINCVLIKVCIFIHKIDNKLCVNKIDNKFELLYFDVYWIDHNMYIIVNVIPF